MTTNHPQVRLEHLLREAGWLRALARNLVDPSRVDDIMQDTWRAALRHEPDPDRPARPWLRRVLQNVASNLRRSEIRRQHRESTAAPRDEAASPLDLAEAAELQRLLATAIERLPEPLRDVIVLAYFHGLDSRQIGSRLGLSPSAIRTRHQRAIEELRESLDRQSRDERTAWLGAMVRFLRTSEATVGRGSLATLAGSGLAACVVLVVTAQFSGWWSTPASRPPEDSPTVETGVANGTAALQPLDTERPQDLPQRVETSIDSASSSTSESLAANPDGMTISGRLLVDGGLPAWELRLRLVDAPDPDESSQVLGPDAMKQRRAPLREIELPTSARGVFRFDGIPAGWSGELFVEGCLALDGKPAVPIACPGLDLVIPLRAGPRLFGSLRLPGGAPLAVEGACEVRIGTTDSPDDRVMVLGFRSTDDGAFSIPLLAKGSIVSAIVRLEVDGKCFLHHQTKQLDARESHDLGSLYAEPVRDLELRVVDRRGEPIPSASIRIDGAGQASREATTDEYGLCSLRYAPIGACSLSVRAANHVDRVLPAPTAATGIIELDPMMGITVRVAPSVVRAKPQIRVISRKPLLATDPNAAGSGDRSRNKIAGGPISVRTEGEPPNRWIYSFECPPNGVLRVERLLPDVDFEIEAIDSTGAVLARSQGNSGAPTPSEIQLPIGRGSFR